MNVPFVDLKAQYEKVGEEIRDAIEGVILDSAFIGGKYLKSFEENFAGYIGTKHCIGVGNGTDALFIALKALGIEAGDEVVTAANSFIATSEAITMTGAQVVFVDCDKDTYNIDIDKIEESISTRTRAIIPVHLYGRPVDMDRIMDLAKKHELYVIEDAAQAHGAEYKSQKVGTFGHVGCFSFYPAKNLGAYGDGGAIVTYDDDLAKKMAMMANHGRMDKYNHEFEGGNSRLDGLQAAILDVKLRHLEKWNKRRREVAWRYSEALHDVVFTPKERPDVRHVYHLYVIRVGDRDKIRAILSEKGITTGIHYPIPLPFLKAYQYLGHRPCDFPVAYSLKDEIISIPIYGDMTDAQVDYVIRAVKNAVKRLQKKR